MQYHQFTTHDDTTHEHGRAARHMYDLHEEEDEDRQYQTQDDKSDQQGFLMHDDIHAHDEARDEAQDGIRDDAHS